MKDGSAKSYEQEAKPFWSAGMVVKAKGGKLEKP
jgi:hypothetical protein